MEARARNWAQLFDVAQNWRKLNGYLDRGGVLVFFDGVVQGWVNVLRNPEHWQPGCIAVDERGRTWTATGGDGQHGAAKWVPNFESKEPYSKEPYMKRTCSFGYYTFHCPHPPHQFE
jgi:hypothetical protein